MEKRVQKLNGRPSRDSGQYVLYWSQMNRRVDSNHALAFAAQLANERRVPLLVYEGLTCSYPYANDRFHTFILDGVPETARRLAALGIGYHFYLRRTHLEANDRLYRLAAQATDVVTDDYPVFVTRNHNTTVPAKLETALWCVDSSCVVPMRQFDRREYAAYTIRPKIRRLLPHFLTPVPALKVRRAFRLELAEPGLEVTAQNIPALVASCEIDHSVPPAALHEGGRLAAEARLAEFLQNRLRRYARDRNEPAANATSGLSPYLHFGQMSSLEVALAATVHAQEHRLMADEFLEELIVRRELAFNFALHTKDCECLANLPDWAQKTLAQHDGDQREFVYSRETFEQAETHDPLWNAAQQELLLTGRIHGYYRMYWGKKIIEWSASHEQALKTMIYLHDRYAIDGRDPNTYTNILWCFGLHDRPWQERPVFGMVRYMSYEGMRRKTNVDAYLRDIKILATQCASHLPGQAASSADV